MQSLPGKVGKNDVADCIAALDAAAETGAAYKQAHLPCLRATLSLFMRRVWQMTSSNGSAEHELAEQGFRA